MKNKFRFSGLLAVLVLFTALCSILSVAVYAYDDILPDRETSLSLVCKYDGQPLDGVTVHIYKVANVSASATYTLTGAFSAYKVDVGNVGSKSQWNAVALTLAGYIYSDGLEAIASAQTDSDGTAAFTGLDTGLYLVLADSFSNEQGVFLFTPYLVSLPNLDDVGNWLYDVTSVPKCELTGGSETSYSVVKHWADSGSESERPQSITVEIFRDGLLYDTQTLSSDNNWSYTWRVESDSSVWSIAEKDVQSCYTVLVARDSAVFTVTNTYHAPSPTPAPTTPPDSLPQTGLLWWPVWLLTGAGLVLIIAGNILMRKDEKRDNTP